MGIKRCQTDLNDNDDDGTQRAARLRYDNESNIEHLQRLINNQLEMLQPQDLNITDQIQNFINDQLEWLEIPNNPVQVGQGPNDRFNYDPSLPQMGLNQIEIDRLITEGGSVGGFRVTPRLNFNALEIHRTLNFRDIITDNLAAYNILFTDILNEIVTFSRLLAGQNGFINISLRGHDLPSDINYVLSPENDYSVESFADEIEKKTLQSNIDIPVDAPLELSVSIVRNRYGGVRRKLTDLVHNDVIRKN